MDVKVKGSEVRRIRKTQPNVSLMLNAGRSQITVEGQRFQLGGPSDMRQAWNLVNQQLFGFPLIN